MYFSDMRVGVADIADAIEQGLRRAFVQHDSEQAVYGLDSRDEVELHPLIESCLRDAGYGVFREQRYPADRQKRGLSEGERCDFVLTPDGRPLVREESRGTLFDLQNAVDLSDAFWLEVKIVAQFNAEGPNANYASQLLSTVRHDVTKLSKDPGILHAGLLLVLFVRELIVADHDLQLWQDRCLGRGLPIGAPSRRSVSLTDRHGHSVCMIAVYPVSHL